MIAELLFDQCPDLFHGHICLYTVGCLVKDISRLYDHGWRYHLFDHCGNQCLLILSTLIVAVYKRMTLSCKRKCLLTVQVIRAFLNFNNSSGVGACCEGIFRLYVYTAQNINNIDKGGKIQSRIERN